MSTYRLVAVPPVLSPYVREIAIEGEDHDPQNADRRYTVYPGPFPALGIQYRGALSVIRGSGEQPLEQSGLTGLMATARQFQPREQARSILVRFEPDGAHALLGCDMSEVADAHVGLSALLGSAVARTLGERIAEAATDEGRVRVVESALIALSQQRPRRPHPVVPEAIRRIRASGGRQRIESLAEDVGISPRQLERLFRVQVGVGPKRFASIVQFDRARQLLTARVPAAAAAVEAGYADQAHLTREFQARAGRTPSRYLGAVR